MTDEKIDEIVQLLEPASKSKSKKTKSKKQKKDLTDINESINKTGKAKHYEINSLVVENKNNSEEMKDKEIAKLIKRNRLLLKKENNYAVSIADSKAELMANLMTNIEKAESERTKMRNELAKIESRKMVLANQCLEKDMIVDKLRTKKENMQNIITKAMNSSKIQISQLEQTLKHLESKLVKPKHEPTITKTFAFPHQGYFNSISQKISLKEKELECPVCLDTATAPILMCEEQHLICSNCR